MDPYDTSLGVESIEEPELSYDDTVPYSELPPPTNGPSLVDRIGNTKVYLLADVKAKGKGGEGGASGKRKRGEEDEDEVEREEVILGEDDGQDMDTDEDPNYRPNALLLHGPPISHLPTDHIFAYAKHFDAHPIALEWINDDTCVLVFPKKSDARLGYRYLSKSSAEEPLEDEQGFVHAKTIPVALWPKEDRIRAGLGFRDGEGLKGTVKMRWARREDVKKKGAGRDSEFYRKHGRDAGKVGDEAARRKRRRGENGVLPGRTEEEIQRELDEELDEFLAEEEREKEEREGDKTPSGKMYADLIDGGGAAGKRKTGEERKYSNRGKSLLERTSMIRAHPTSTSLADRIEGGAPAVKLSERLWDVGKVAGGDGEEDERRRTSRGGRGRNGGGREREREREKERGHKSREELDNELDAFLNERG